MQRKKVKILRIEKNLSQDKLGKMLNVSSQYISLIENGKANGSYGFWHRFKTVFNIPDEEIESYKTLTEFN